MGLWEPGVVLCDVYPRACLTSNLSSCRGVDGLATHHLMVICPSGIGNEGFRPVIHVLVHFTGVVDVVFAFIHMAFHIFSRGDPLL